VIVDQRTLARLAEATRFADVREFETIGSTNTYLLGEARAGAAEGTVAVADHQTAGRGRLGRTWTAPPGTSLLVSVLLRPTHLASERRYLTTAAFALAASQACETVAGFIPELKWPNDLLAGDRKLAGILAETERDAVVIGMGINVGSAPPGGVSVDELAGHPVDRGELLAATLEAFEGWYRDPDPQGVMSAYRKACVTIGRHIRVELPDGQLTGQAQGIDERGHLVVRSDDGTVVDLASGDVVHVRPS
jgi:BirA family transcriptional regulator, biotin operon repressor / biotin---[acetyl-CoA-carboxylase] ligase